MVESKQAPPLGLVKPKHHHFHPFIGLTLIISGFCLAVLLQYGHTALSSFHPRVDPGHLESGMAFAENIKQLTLGVGPILGNPDASVAIVEFSDYECPLCHEYFKKTYPLIQKNFIDTGKVQYEIRNYPLPKIHPHAIIAAEAALCALQQNAFEEMHDALFTNQAVWAEASEPVSVLLSYAKNLNLDSAEFQTCLETHATQKTIDQDIADAKSAGINGTPTFWIFKDGVQVQQVNGAYPYAFFEQVFDNLLTPQESSSSSAAISSSSSTN